MSALDTQELLNAVYDSTDKSLKVTSASGGSSTPVTNTPASGATAVLANVASSASSVTLQAANTARLGWTVFNDSTANLFVKFGSTASATSFVVKLAAGGFYEMAVPLYNGIVTGIWDSATGSARVMELTA